MGRRHKRKKKQRSQMQTFVSAAEGAVEKADQPETQLHAGLGINLQSDEAVIADQRGVGREIRNIALLMIALAAVVAVVAIINARTSYVNTFGGYLMQWLHIWGA